jgi:hypothetical protein
MMGISLTAIVCSASVLTASVDEEAIQVSSCQIYIETRPMADLRSCLFPTARHKLGLEALERAGRQLEPDESVDSTCRRITGGGGVAAG